MLVYAHQYNMIRWLGANGRQNGGDRHQIIAKKWVLKRAELVSARLSTPNARLASRMQNTGGISDCNKCVIL